MERLAWLAWHFLLPYRKKGSRLTPRDLLPKPEGATRKRVLTPAEARRELEDLEREMGAR